MAGQNSESGNKNAVIATIVVLILVNFFLVVLLCILFVSKNGLTPVIASLSTVSSNEVKMVKRGDKVDLQRAKDKIQDFNDSDIERLELKLSEEEVNAMMSNYIEEQAKLSKQDKPSEKTQKDLNLEGFTDLFSETNYPKVRVDLEDEKAEVYVSYDEGKRWMGFLLETSEDKEKSELEFTAIEALMPEFIEQMIVNELSIGLRDASTDFNDKALGKRKIEEVKFSNENLVVVGVIE